MADDARRHSTCDDQFRQGLRDNRASADDGSGADVGENDRRAPNPGALADADGRFLSWLVANGRRDVLGAVGMSAARHVHTGREEHIALDVHQPQVAARSDVGVLANRRSG